MCGLSKFNVRFHTLEAYTKKYFQHCSLSVSMTGFIRKSLYQNGFKPAVIRFANRLCHYMFCQVITFKMPVFSMELIIWTIVAISISLID